MSGLESYPCDKKGLVLLINNEFIGSPQYRAGSEKDVEKIRELFELKLNGFYNVNVVIECTLAKMLEQFENCRRKLKSGRYNQFICFILSHGHENGILTSDFKFIKPEAIEEHFNARQVEKMAQLPKVFVFQACRGDQHQPSIRVGGGEGSGGRNIVEDSGLPVCVPINANILMAYATTKGKVSFRNPDTGSWFIQSLCRVFKKHFRKHDVLS